MGKQVLVVPTDKLFNLIPYFQGFLACKRGILRILEENSMWLDRKQAEEDPSFKQLIGYCAITGSDKRIFTYQRAKQDEKYPEKKLQGKWSIGVGGHIEPHDSLDNGLISASVQREIGEEIEMDSKPTRIDLVGIINDDLNPVGRVHFGLFMLAHSTAKTIKPKDPEIAFGELKNQREIGFLFEMEKSNVDHWSLIGFPHILL